VWLDSETDREAAASRMRTALHRASLGASTVYALFIMATAVGGRPGVELRSWTTLLDAIDTAVALGVLGRSRRGPRTLDELHALAFVLVLAGCLNSIGTAYLLHDPRELFYLALYSLALGAVAIYRLATAIVLAVIAVAGVAVAAHVGTGADAGWMFVVMAATVIAAAAIQIGQREHLALTATLQAQDRARSAELAAALERLQKELAERKRAEADRAELEARLWQVQKLDALGTLAGGIAHDINNVLGAIVGVAEVAREEAQEGSSSHDDFEHILAAAQRGAALTRNLLGFARRGKHRDEAFRVDETIEEVVALLARTAPKGVRFVAELGAGSAYVMGDPAQISQALMNVCLNAIEAMNGEGSVQIVSSRVTLGEHDTPTLAAGRYVSIEVIDDGAGMDESTLAHAFEPFYSSKSSTTHHSGLGLAMIYGTMRDHEGEVLLRSKVNEGTTAILRLPEVDAPAKAIADTETSATHDIVSGPVLIIDDEPAVRRAMRRFLEAAHIESVEANGGVAGLQLFRAAPQSFSLVLLDLAMPEMSGAECFAHLRALDPAVPILIVSGYPKDQNVETLLATGRSEFLSKPFSTADIMAAVRRWRRPSMDLAQREA
jgi:two-component system, cell cycle sensor histidine kinase and response regulator CckA